MEKFGDIIVGFMLGYLTFPLLLFGSELIRLIKEDEFKRKQRGK